MKLGWNRIDVTLTDDESLYVRTGSFLRHPDSLLKIPHMGKLPLSRISKQMYFLFHARGGSFSLTTPYEEACISQVSLEPGEIIIIKMDHILAFSSDMFFRRRWKIDLISILSSQFRYVYFQGPGKLYYFGLGELSAEILDTEKADYDQGSVIGWSNTLKVGVASRSSVLSALFAKEDICLDRFVGSGRLLTQASTVKKLPKRFHDPKANSSWLDYLNALLGLRI